MNLIILGWIMVGIMFGIIIYTIIQFIALYYLAYKKDKEKLKWTVKN